MCTCPTGAVLVPSTTSTSSTGWLACASTWPRWQSRQTPVAVCGDFNIAPTDKDVWDPAAFVGATHVTPEERQALADLESWGLVDAFRQRWSEEGLYTYWDYRAGDFHEHRGMRIDLILLSKVLAKKVTWALVDRNARKGKLPSDHAPLFVDVKG